MVKKKVRKSKGRISSGKAKKTSVKKSVGKTKRILVSKRKVSLVLRNLILFVVLSLLSLGLKYGFTGKNETLVNFFLIISLISAFVAVAFLIVYLVLFFMKLFK